MLMLYEKGQPMSHDEVEEQFRLAQNTRMLPYTARFSKYWAYAQASAMKSNWFFSGTLPVWHHAGRFGFQAGQRLPRFNRHATER